MNRLLLVLVAALTASISLDAVAQTPESPLETADRDKARAFVLGAVLKPGDATERVREVQASLNRELRNRTIGLPKEAYTVRMAVKDEETGEERVPKLSILRRGIELNLHDSPPNRWYADPEENSLTLPEKPLQVDGIYGQQTYAAVLVFQHLIHLQETGTVDVVTLDKLEPMIPSKWFLAKVMSWVDRVLKAQAPGLYSAETTKRCTAIVVTILILFVGFVAHRAARGIAKAPTVLQRLLAPWLGAFIEGNVFRRMAHFAPALVIYLGAALVFPSDEFGRDPFPYLETFQNSHIVVSRLGLAYAALVLMLVALAIVDSVPKAYDLTARAIEGIIAVAKLTVALTGVVLIIAALTGRNPIVLVGSLGALMALIILLSRDSIRGFLACIHIASQKIVKIGDWIQMPSHDADGDVLDVTLNSVKVQNFDKTITTIPTYALLEDSFRNLGDIPGRRIKRAILIDIQSVKACTAEMLEGYAGIELLRDYIRMKSEELERYNIGRDVEASVLNSRQLTNIGTFRVYVEAYLGNHPMLSKEMTCLVRQLDPGRLGLPVELYAFCIETGFKEYEAVQADIFDHVLSILPAFELRAFQDAEGAGRSASHGIGRFRS